MRPVSTLTAPDFGRLCYREQGEPRDGRYALWLRPFWASDEERQAYESAARDNPRVVDVQADEIESSTAYIRRIAQIAGEAILAAPLKPFPPARRMQHTYTGPRPPVVTEGNLSFEDRTDRIYSEREPGEEG